MGIASEHNLSTACNRRNADNTLIRTEGVRPGVVPIRNRAPMRAQHLAAFPQTTQGGLDSLRRTHPERKSRADTDYPVRLVMQRRAVLAKPLPADSEESVETVSLTTGRPQEDLSLFGCKLQRLDRPTSIICEG
jgi:hypothetical protein